MHLNIHTALRQRLKGTGCRPLGADAAVAIIGDAVRYPDALVTCTPITGDEYVAPNAAVVFEVISATSGRTDRIVKSANTLQSPLFSAMSSWNRPASA